MELRIENGDYIRDGRGGLIRAEGEEALLQRVLFRLSAHRGALPMLPELGSRLYLLGREKPAERLAAARQYVAEAVTPEGLVLQDLTLEYRADGRMGLTVWLERNPVVLTVSLVV